MKTLIFFLFFLFTNLYMQAQCTYIGGYNGLWSVPGNWSCGHVPLPTDNVVITELMNLDVSAIVNDLNLTYPGPTLYGAGALTVNGTLNMQANIENSGGVTINGTLNWGYTFQGTGTVNCNGTNNIGASGSVGIDQMTVSLNSGGNWTNNHIFMCCGSVLQVPVGATLEHTGTNGNFHNYASGVTVKIFGTFKKSTAGTIAVTNSTDLYNSGTISLETATSTLLIDPTVHTFFNSGLLEGNGTLNVYPINFAQTGSFSPGINAPGIFNLAQSLPAGTTNTYIDLQGTATPGIDYDQIAVNGTGVISGTLNINFLNGFTPTIGDQFIIMTCTGGCSGSFSNIVHPGNNPGAWAIDLNTPGQVKLKLVQVLPIELADFSAKQMDDDVRLQWTTASEADNQGFYIERMAMDDDGRWKEIGFVAGQGTTTKQHTYSFLDEQPLPGINYYRLRQVDMNGKETLSAIIQVRLKDLPGRQFVYPNPVAAGMEWTLGQELFDGEAIVSLRILDVTGRQVATATNGQQLLTKDLTPGIYWLQVQSERGYSMEKVVVQ